MSWKNFLIAVLASAVIVLLFKGNCNSKELSPASTKPSKEIVKTVQIRSAKDSMRVDSLTRIATNLQRSVAVINYNLESSRLLVAQMRDSLRTVIQIVPENEFEINRDLLIAQVDRLKEAEQVKDSLCDESRTSLETIVAVKDDIITTLDSSNDFLQTSIDALAGENQKLGDYSKQLEKKLKRKSFGNKLWKGAAVVAGLFILKTTL